MVQSKSAEDKVIELIKEFGYWDIAKSHIFYINEFSPVDKATLIGAGIGLMMKASVY